MAFMIGFVVGGLIGAAAALAWEAYAYTGRKH